MSCIFVLLLLIPLTVLPLAVRSRIVARVLLLAIAFEASKYLFASTLARWLLELKSELLNSFLAVLIFLAALPELFIGHTHEETIPLQTKIIMIVCGIIWNMIPAYLISLCLPAKRVADDLRKPPEGSSI